MRKALTIAIVLAGCGSSAPMEDAGPPPNCDEPDRACPSGAPVWGGPCEGTLSCPYESCGPDADDVYECVAGEWSLTMPAACAGGGPPLAESCTNTFAGTLEGGRVWISADRAGAPELGDGDAIEVAFGAQGFAMVPYRVHVEGTGELPACVALTATVSLDEIAGAAAPHDIRLRCGSSLRIQDILPSLPCEFRSYAVHLDVAVEGVGSVSRDLTLMGGMCPR
jgi:hypothetical protein